MAEAALVGIVEEGLGRRQAAFAPRDRQLEALALVAQVDHRLDFDFITEIAAKTPRLLIEKVSGPRPAWRPSPLSALATAALRSRVSSALAIPIAERSPG